MADDDFNPQEFLRGRGVTPRSQGGGPPTQERPSFPPPPPDTTGASDPDPGRERRAAIIHEFQAEDPDYPAGREFYRGAAQTAFNLGNLIAPSTLESLAQRYPLVRQAREFAGQEPDPNESWGEWTGRQAGAYVPLSILGGGLGRLVGMGTEAVTSSALGRAAAQRFPAVFGRGGFTGGPPPQVMAQVARTARRTGRTAGAATAGGVAGAVEDPEHPIAGAVGGAIVGSIPMVSGAFLKSEIAKRAGGAILPAAATAYAIHGITGGGWMDAATKSAIAHALIANIRWHRMPVGNALYVSGRNVVDAAGHLVGHIPASFAGYVAGPATGGAARDVLREGGGAGYERPWTPPQENQNVSTQSRP